MNADKRIELEQENKEYTFFHIVKDVENESSLLNNFSEGLKPIGQDTADSEQKQEGGLYFWASDFGADRHIDFLTDKENSPNNESSNKVGRIEFNIKSSDIVYPDFRLDIEQNKVRAKFVEQEMFTYLDTMNKSESIEQLSKIINLPEGAKLLNFSNEEREYVENKPRNDIGNCLCANIIQEDGNTATIRLGCQDVESVSLWLADNNDEYKDKYSENLKRLFNNPELIQQYGLAFKYCGEDNLKIAKIKLVKKDNDGNLTTTTLEDKKNNPKTFEEIISLATDDVMLQDYEGITIDTFGRERTDISGKKLSEEEQKLNLAFYARAAINHVGFEGFGEENNQAFKQGIVDIYNNISGERVQSDFIKDMMDQTSQYMLDRHFVVSLGNQTFEGGGLKEETNVGRNIANCKELTAQSTAEDIEKHYKPEEYTVVANGDKTGQDGKPFKAWEIGTINKNGEDILVVSIPALTMDNSYEGWQDFIEAFDGIYLDNKEKWDKGGIVLDVRGNGGGEDKPIDHVAKRLYGNMTNSYKKCEIKDTPLANKLLHKHGAFKPQNLANSGLTPDDILQRKEFSGKNQVIFDETETYYPYNQEKGYKGKIDILLDRGVGSSAESAYTSFYHHPNVRYVGQNTAGQQQYTQGSITMPGGCLMRCGVTSLTYYDKEGENIEVKGHKPDFNCEKHNALKVALEDRDTSRVVGSRKLNEPITGKMVYKEYNPKISDERKAYHAKYIEPAIRKVEAQNILDKKKHTLSKEDDIFKGISINPAKETLQAGTNHNIFTGININPPKKINIKIDITNNLSSNKSR